MTVTKQYVFLLLLKFKDHMSVVKFIVYVEHCVGPLDIYSTCEIQKLSSDALDVFFIYLLCLW